MAKTNVGLLEYVKSKIGTPYLYGAKMELITPEKYASLKKLYGLSIKNSDASKIGKVCCDCSGLISSYTNVMRTSTGFKTSAEVVNSINTIKEAPLGALVWCQGHVGVYSGTKDDVPYYIAIDGSNYPCRETKLSNNNFTHWFLCADIEYLNDKAIIINLGNNDNYTINNNELELLYKFVHVEANNGDLKEQIMITNVIINQLKNEKFPNTILEILSSNNHFIDVKDIEVNITATNKKAVHRALQDEDYSDGSIHFCLSNEIDVNGWAELNLSRNFNYGNHIFYKEAIELEKIKAVVERLKLQNKTSDEQYWIRCLLGNRIVEPVNLLKILS